mmetsp:Transcript_31388/g.56869  ORF Transcript_31388/g.56869 Transcript_31388/m.56869 type:complete len:444 (-) Transcript_31388:121-1452(-)|eukprot:CAMPEP_0197624162 /NCGR_PEP_ID=MMETSP1338-20131121/3918_1 /TAXON_ID=43686 ORGANISM="Pelagodinium beii, Strain RCC1491" /NCGR_SAMPLE_ID=MMETSP1338 /ASSEMBLY_ACC=CAM_ASM_000754 /LENGTH=443 /DNA_ID=CAMNT_0043194263 /DNA_START=74 /DNA_END=1405 /DNA_ORIENTATION=-
MRSTARPQEDRKAICAVLRHAEREDTKDLAWSFGPEARAKYPLDPALTASGEQSVAITGRQLVNLVEPVGHFHVVVSSPYMRCIQTAVQLCLCIGPQVRLLVDNELGEIYGPAIMGDEEPMEVRRPDEEIEAYCNHYGVQISSRKLGVHPVWPENIPNARNRFVRRFLQYLHRARVTRRNFVLVTHGDAVASALTVMPSLEGRLVNKVCFGGFFVATSGTDGESAPGTPHGDADYDMPNSTSEDPLHDPKGWHVTVHGINVSSKAEQPIGSRILSWSRKTGFDEQKMMKLLRCLPPPSLVDEAATSKTEQPLDIPLGLYNQDPGTASPISSVGASTMIFAGGSSTHSSPAKDYSRGFVPELSPIASADHTPEKEYMLDSNRVNISHAAQKLLKLSGDDDSSSGSTVVPDLRSRSTSGGFAFSQESTPTFLQRRSGRAKQLVSL